MTYNPQDWQPGAVAMVTIGSDEQVALRVRDAWETIHERVRDDTLHDWRRITDARPLVVLDPESRDDALRLKRALDVDSLLYAQRTLRELVTPPKPPEPTGLGAVVEDAEGADWHRSRTGRWIAEDGLRTRAGGWGHIDAVRVLSEGVTP